VRLQNGEVNILGGLIQRSESRTTTGLPGLSQVPFLRYFTSDNVANDAEQEVLIVVIPHVIRTPGITAENMRAIASGTDTNPAIRLESEVMLPAAQVPAPLAPPAAAPPAPSPAPGSAAQVQGAQLGFEPANITLHAGETTTIGVVVRNAQDLFSIPILLQFDPAIVMVDDVRQGGFLSGGTQPIAIVQRVDKERGQAIISATRMPNTQGISGDGTLFGVVVRGIAPGSSRLSIVQVNGRDSQQRPLQFVTMEGAVQVQP
jgi:general secretion pathway protein D